MKIEIFRELHPYSLTELESRLSLNEDSVSELLKSLSLMNIVRKLSKNASKIELEELFGIDSLEKINNEFKDEMFLFKYVGMLTIKNVCIIIYPKYMDSYLEDKANNYLELKQLISVIRKYESKQQNQRTILGDGNEQNLLAITLALIEDYIECGLYTNNRQVIEEDGFGEILWDKTINESPVYISNGVPLYLDLFTINQESNEQDYFRQLHRIVISSACSQLEDVLNIMGVDTVILTESKLSSLGNNEYIIGRINQELGLQFVTRKQSILKLIKSYIANEEGSHTDERISFVGTNSFNLVWEDVCSRVYGDCINFSIQEMGLRFKEGTKYSATLAEVIEKPIWTHFASGKSHRASKTLIPDIITIKDGIFSIYDAKYYRIKLDEYSIEYNPGVGDVTKQYLYELAYKDFIKENSLKMQNNAFLLPSDSEEEKIIGTVSMDIFGATDDIELKAIELILIPCKDVFEKYLKL